MPAVEPTRTSEPWPRSATPRRKPRAVKKLAVRFASGVSRQRSRGSSQTGTSARGQTPATAAQTSSGPGRRKELVDLGFVRQIRAGDQSAGKLVGERLRSVTAAVVMEDDTGTLGGECTGAGRADPA